MELHVRHEGARAGAGPSATPPVVLLHGFTGSARAWGDPLLEGLAQGGERCVLAVDLPGHGHGTDAPGLDPADPPRFVEVVDTLADFVARSEAGRAHWIGYSMGGRLALAVAARHPERVARLVLESASPGLESEAERSARRDRDEELATRLLREGIGPFVDRWMALPLFDSQRRLPAGTLRAERARRLLNDPGSLAAVLRGMGTGAQPSYWAALARIEPPVLLLTGSLDARFEVLAERMQARLPRGRRVSVPGAGHAVHLEAPERWLGAVLSFITET